MLLVMGTVRLVLMMVRLMLMLVALGMVGEVELWVLAAPHAAGVKRDRAAGALRGRAGLLGQVGLEAGLQRGKVVACEGTGEQGDGQRVEVLLDPVDRYPTLGIGQALEHIAQRHPPHPSRFLIASRSNTGVSQGFSELQKRVR